MKNKPVLVGLVVVFGLSLALLGFWRSYSEKLTRGMEAPPAHKILNEMEEKGVPEFSLKQPNGEPLKLSDYKGKIVLLNFWASWCEPCIKEFPSMISLVEKMKGELILLAISADYEEQDMKNFLKAFKVDSPYIYVAWDKDQETAKSYGTFTLPESYIIGKKGELIRKVSGIEEWDTPDAIEYFESLISQ